jgi:hypothetical protein
MGIAYGNSIMDFFINAGQAGRVTVTPNPSTGFKACKICGFILQLRLPVCSHQGCLAHLMVVAWLHLSQDGVVGYYLFFSA